MAFKTLKNKQDFKYVFLNGEKRIGQYVILYFVPSLHQENRLGIIVKKNIGNAVQRNKVKRRIRELWRNKYVKFLSNYDVIFLIRKSFIFTSIRSIEEDIDNLLNNL